MDPFRGACERFVLRSISRKILFANSAMRLWVQLLAKALIICIIFAGTDSTLEETAYAIIHLLKGRFRTLRLAQDRIFGEWLA
jgi:hypothetical protein